MKGFFYLATPYSAHPGGVETAFQEACLATAELIRAGIPVFSPIAHTHPVGKAGRMDLGDSTIWLPADQPMMDAAVGVIVVRLPGWEKSHGIGYEIEVFKTAGKPVLYIDQPASMPPSSVSRLIEKVGDR